MNIVSQSSIPLFFFFFFADPLKQSVKSLSASCLSNAAQVEQ